MLAMEAAGQAQANPGVPGMSYKYKTKYYLYSVNIWYSFYECALSISIFIIKMDITRPNVAGLLNNYSYTIKANGKIENKYTVSYTSQYADIHSCVHYFKITSIHFLWDSGCLRWNLVT